jgi:hypothetical protein
MDDIPEGCTPKDAQVLRRANHWFAQRVIELEEALNPFVQHMSSDECITVQLRNEWIARGRRLLAGAEKCDGNHAAPACGDPGCWQSEVPVVMHPLHQEVWPSVASAQLGGAIPDDTPLWMDTLAHAVADKHESTDHGALKEAVIDAMKEASREVALYFAANPDGIKGHVIAKCVNDLRDIAIEFHASQQLRERISHRIHEFLGSKP